MLVHWVTIAVFRMAAVGFAFASCVRVCVCVRLVIKRFQVRFPAGPLWCCCCFLEQETLLTLLQSTQLLKWGPGGLVPTGEAAHPAVTSMGTWCKLGKQMLDCPCLIWQLKVQVGLDAHTFNCEIWYSLLRVTSLPQEGMPALTHST